MLAPHPLPPIFSNPEHQALYEQQGFVVLPLLELPVVEQLVKLFWQEHPELPEKGFISDSYLSDNAYKKRVSDLFIQHLQPRFKEVFQDYTPYGGAYLYKLPGAESELMMHQDWSIVDEEQYESLNIWLPLTDMTADKGPLWVLPGSHYAVYPVKRSPTMPYFFQGEEERVLPRMVPMIIPAGHAVVLSQSLVHYSPANQTDQVRLALTCGVKTRNAPMQFYHHDTQRTPAMLERYAMPEDFMVSFTDFVNQIQRRPENGHFLDETPYHPPQPRGHELEALLDHMLERAGYPAFPNLPEDAQPVRTLSSESPRAEWAAHPLPNRWATRVPMLGDPKLQHQLTTEGYTIFDLLDTDQVQQLKADFNTRFPNPGPGLFASAHAPDLKERDACNELIRSVIEDTLKPFVAAEAQLQGGSYLNKGPGNDVLQPHQDWSITDERSKRSYTLWIPLQDVDETNGCLWVLPGSHRFMPRFRSWNMGSVMGKVYEEALKVMKPLRLKAGQAIMFDHSLVHASLNNSTQENRVAVLYGIQTQNLQYYYPFQETNDAGEGQLALYYADRDFFLHYQHGDESDPDLELAERIPYNPPQITLDFLRMLYPALPYTDVLDWQQNQQKLTCDPEPANSNTTEESAAMPNPTPEVEPVPEPVLVSKQANDPAKQEEPQYSEEYQAWLNRTFWQTYTPLNIYREIRNRLLGRN